MSRTNTCTCMLPSGKQQEVGLYSMQHDQVTAGRKVAWPRHRGHSDCNVMKAFTNAKHGTSGACSHPADAVQGNQCEPGPLTYL